MKKALTGVLLLSGLVLAGCTDQTVASSTAGKISEDALYTKMKETVGTQVLQQMLLEDVLKKNSGDAVTDKDVEASFKEEVERFGDEESLNYALMSEGMTLEQYKENIHLNLLVKDAVEKSSDFSDADIQQAYDDYQPQVTAAHILVTEKETANDLLEKIENGDDFAELAKEFSEDEGTAELGGEVTFSKGEMVPEFEEAAYALEEGEITEKPVESSYGYHIVKLIEKPEKGSLEDEKDMIMNQLLEEKMADGEYVHAILSDIVNDSNIVINDDDLSNAMDSYAPLPDPEESGIEEEQEGAEPSEDSSETDSSEDSE